MKSAVALRISSHVCRVVSLGKDRYSSSAKYMGWGCCQTRREFIAPGALRPVGSVILDHLAPLYPWAAARSRDEVRKRWYVFGMLRRNKGKRFQRANCAV